MQRGPPLAWVHTRLPPPPILPPPPLRPCTTLRLRRWRGQLIGQWSVPTAAARQLLQLQQQRRRGLPRTLSLTLCRALVMAAAAEDGEAQEESTVGAVCGEVLGLVSTLPGAAKRGTHREGRKNRPTAGAASTTIRTFPS